MKKGKGKAKKEKVLKKKNIIKFFVFLLIFILIFFILYSLFYVFSVNKIISDNNIIRYKGSLTLKEGETCNVVWRDVSICIPDSFFQVETTDDSFLGYTDSSSRHILMAPVQGTLKGEIETYNINAEKFMKKYQFQDVVDVLHYYEKNQKERISVFSFPHSTKEYYIIWALINVYLPEGDLYYIEGDYYGYLIKQKNNYTVYLYNDSGKLYNISFGNSSVKDDYFTDENVQEILSSIRLKD